MFEGNIKTFQTYTPRLDPNAHNSRQPRLSVKDLDDYRSPSPLQSESRDRSKAVASAMRSLQEKIKQLEGENAGLRSNYVELEDRYVRDRERWQQKLLTEVGAVNEKHRDVHIRDERLSVELNRTRESFEELKEKLQIAEGRVRVLETENRRSNEQTSIDRENGNLQIINLQRKLEQVEDEAKELRLINQRLETDRKVQAEELMQAEQLITSLKDELSYLRDHSELTRSTLQSSLASSEAQLIKKNAEYEQQLRQLEVKNRSLTELSENHKRQLEYLKKEIAEIQQAKGESDIARHSMLKKSQRAEAVVKDAMSLNEQLVDAVKTQKYRRTQPRKTTKRPRSASKPLTPKPKAAERHVPAQAQTSRTRESTEVDWEIRRLEDTISNLNKQYRNMLQNSYTSSTDLKSLRVQLNAIAETLEDKTNELYRLKRMQQTALKEQIAY